MRPLHIALAYIVFAALATITNVTTQALALRAYNGPAALMLSIAAGTGAGLIIKYLLDKRYIFRFFARNATHDARTFALYAFTGVLTTLLFWSFELGFYYALGTEQAKYTGAVLGLSIGYALKYRLDKKHVFRREQVA